MRSAAHGVLGRSLLRFSSDKQSSIVAVSGPLSSTAAYIILPSAFADFVSPTLEDVWTMSFLPSAGHAQLSEQSAFHC